MKNKKSISLKSNENESGDGRLDGEDRKAPKLLMSQGLHQN